MFSLIALKIAELQKRFNDLSYRLFHARSIYVIFKIIDLDLDPEIAVSLNFSLKLWLFTVTTSLYCIDSFINYMLNLNICCMVSFVV